MIYAALIFTVAQVVCVKSWRTTGSRSGLEVWTAHDNVLGVAIAAIPAGSHAFAVVLSVWRVYIDVVRSSNFYSRGDLMFHFSDVTKGYGKTFSTVECS